MPLALLLGLVKNVNSLPAFDWFKPCLKPSDIVYIGLRDLDSAEKRVIKELGIKAFTVYYNSYSSFVSFVKILNFLIDV